MNNPLEELLIKFQEKVSLINFNFWAEETLTKSTKEVKLYEAEQEALAQIERDWVKKSEVLAAIIQTVSLTSSYQQGDHWIDANELKDRLNLEK